MTGHETFCYHVILYHDIKLIRKFSRKLIYPVGGITGYEFSIERGRVFKITRHIPIV